MSTPTLFVGIDVSKEKLEVYFQTKSFELLNQAGPLAKFMHQLLALEVPLQIICEATGGYEEALLQSAHPHGVPICCVQPLRVRQFALSKGLLAKNDRLDARLLADFGQSIQPRLTPPTRALQKQISELFTFSRLLIEQRTAVVNELEHSISTKQLAALVGVAPFVRDSGPRCAKRSIRGAEPSFVLIFIWLLCLPLALTPSFAVSTTV